MHSYTLNNWDGSQSRKQVSSAATEKVDSRRPNTLFDQHDGSISPNTQTLGPTSNGRLPIGASSSAVPVKSLASKSVESINSQRGPMANEYSKPRDTFIRRDEESHQYAVDLTTLISGVAQDPATPIRSQTLSGSRIQVQVQSSRSQIAIAKAISGFPAPITTPAPTTSIVARKAQISSVHSSANYISERSDHVQETPSKPPRSSNRIATATATGHSALPHPDINNPYDRKPGPPDEKVKSGPSPSTSFTSKPSTTLTNSTKVQAIPDAVSSRYRRIQSKVLRPSVVSTSITDPVQTQSTSTTFSKLATTDIPHGTTPLHPETITQPITQTNYQRHTSKLLASEPSTSSIKNGHNPAKTAWAPSVPLHPDPLISIPISHQGVDSDYTSADADGESIDDLDLETLEPPQSTTQSQASFLSTSGNLCQSSQSSFTQRLDNEPNSAYDHSPLVRSPSQPPHSTIHQKLRRPQSLQFVCVEIPPLMPGKNKADYRSLNKLKGARTLRNTRRLRPQNDGADYEAAGQKRLRRERDRMGQERKAAMVQANPVASASASALTVPAGHTAHKQSEQEKKSVLSSLSMRQPDGNSSEKVQSIGSNASKKENQQDSLTISASRQPAPPSSGPSSHSENRAESSTRTLLEPDPLPIPKDKANELPLAAIFENPTVQEIKLQYAEHTPAAAVYFNTRFAQTTLDASKWTDLGMRVHLKCVESQRFFAESNEDGEVELEGNFSAGGPLLWRCQIFDEESPSPPASWKEQARSSIATKLSDEERNSSFSHVASLLPPVTPVPKLDLAQVYKLQKVASSRKGRHRRGGEDARPRVEDPVRSPNVLITESGSSQTPSTSIANPQQDTPRYLSEKARGKQKAVDPDLFDTVPMNAPPATIPSPTPSIATPHCPTVPTDTIASSLQSLNPHDTFDGNMEDYVVFSLSPDKSLDQDNDSESNMASSSRFPITIVSDLGSLSSPIMLQHSENPFRSQSNMENIFLAPHALGSPVSNGLDSTRDGYYSPLNDPFGVTFLEGEKCLNQLTTINPAFLGGGPGDDDDDSQAKSMETVLGGMRGEEITFDQGLEGDSGTSISDETLPGLKKGYQPAAGSPIFTSSGSSSLSRSTTSRWPSQTRSETAPLSRVVARNLSPEFPEYEAANAPSQSDGFMNQSSCTSSRSPSIPSARKPATRRTKFLVFNEDEDEMEEREVQRGLMEYGSSSEETVTVSLFSEDRPLTVLRRRVSTAQTRKFSRARSSAVTSDSPNPGLPRTKQTVRRSTQQWQMGEDRTSCHQCRRKTYYLKMKCPCGKRYCNHCMALRYPERSFCLELDSLDCPSCHNECNCTVCARKRGEDYVSSRVSAAQARHSLLPTHTSPVSPDEARTPLAPVVDLSQLPDSIADIAGPFTFWGSIYDRDGRKFADGFADSGDKVIIAKMIDGYTGPIQGRIVPNDVERVGADGFPISRTFIGGCQPSWQLGKYPIIKELGKRGRARQVRGDEEYQGSADTRWYVGKERLLHLPVVAYTRNLQTPNPFSDLSPLSSISDDSVAEVGLGFVVPSASSASDHTTSHHINSKISAIDTIKDLDVSFDPNTIETKDTIRALANALEACGIIAKIGDACVNP